MHNDLMSMIHIRLVTLFGFTYTFLSMAATHMKNTFVPKKSLFLFTVNGQIKVCTGFMCYVIITLPVQDGFREDRFRKSRVMYISASIFG